MGDHYTDLGHEGHFVVDGPDAVAEARRMHRLATADPELDGTLTGPAHEAKYGLERAAGSAAHWRYLGVDPAANGALETADAPKGSENTAARRAK